MIDAYLSISVQSFKTTITIVMFGKYLACTP